MAVTIESVRIVRRTYRDSDGWAGWVTYDVQVCISGAWTDVTETCEGPEEACAIVSAFRTAGVEQAPDATEEAAETEEE